MIVKRSLFDVDAIAKIKKLMVTIKSKIDSAARLLETDESIETHHERLTHQGFFLCTFCQVVFFVIIFGCSFHFTYSTEKSVPRSYFEV